MRSDLPKRVVVDDWPFKLDAQLLELTGECLHLRKARHLLGSVDRVPDTDVHHRVGDRVGSRVVRDESVELADRRDQGLLRGVQPTSHFVVR
jgi:hypothetical protein